MDFWYGYSPERINPGDTERRLQDIMKVTSGCCASRSGIIDGLYASIIPAGTHRASSVRVAEAAKVIENTQRDVNIALINELAMLFDKLGLDTREVLEAAGTKWNFLPFRPGPGRRPLHRRGPVLPHAQGPAGGFDTQHHPGRAQRQRQHGRLGGRPDLRADGQQEDCRARAPACWCWA